MTDIMNNASTNVRVVVRVRPPTDIEKNGQGKFVVEIMNENILIFDPKEEASPYSGKPGKRQLRDIRKRRHKDLKFAFDYVFGWNSDNDEVFEQSTKTLLNGLLDGYNCSVFAYGATGAGKTHTMLGTESQPGVIFHTMISLYKYISEMSADVICDVAVSYLEVYNEQIRDLLLPRGTLPIREDPDSGVIVPGLSLHKPSNAEELLYMLQFGNKNRTQHSTDANAESSRSHAVFQVFVRQRDRTASISTKVKVGKMCLVDLAGSERATVTNNRGARFREGANINRSLLALGNVINSLADQKSKSHISYRDSKLTRLLKDSLGGNCHTIMIAAISPSHLSYEDTYNTLKYADRAKHIRLDMKKNILNVDFHISQYGQIIKELRNEISELKDKLQKYEGPKLCPSLSLPADLQSLLGSLKTTYDDRCMLREQQLQREIRVSDIHWRLHCKQKCLYRASQLLSPRPEMLQKIHGIVQDLQKKLTGEEVQHKALTQKLQDNTEKLNCLQSKATVIDNKTSVYSQLFEVSSQKLAVGMEVSDLRHYIHHLRRLTRAQEREAVASEALISSLLHLVKLQHTELQHHGTLAPDIAIGYQRVYDLVGQWGVSWVDSENHGQREPFHINSVIDIPLLMSGSVNKTNGTLGCPGRVIGGQVLYPTSPRTANLQMVHAQKSPDVKPTVWREKENASTLNIHAGHTPNANKMGQNSKSASSWITLSQAASDHNQLQLVENLANDLLLTTAVRNDIVSNKLTETSETSGPVCKKDDCTLVLNKPSLQSVSVIDAAQSQSAKHLPLNSLCLNTDRVLAVKNLDSSASQTQILVNSDSCQQAQNSVLSLQMCLHQEVLASKGTCSPTDEGGICAASISGKKDSQMNKENSISCQRQNYNVKRAINFDIVNSSPLRVEGRSYADAVRTPTPTRLPLQNIDNNSPGFLPTATTTKMSKISENEIAGYQPLDNMQCFKQLGMPSLVENLIIGSRSGQNQPSYMHPTRATSQRVRQPSQTRDDSFQPKRIKHKNLFHNRSKSTSVLTKLGWKI